MMFPTGVLILLGLGHLTHNVQGVHEYAAVCPPTHRFESPHNSGCTMYIHTGLLAAQINITTRDDSQVLQLDAGEVQKMSFGEDMQPINGAESKAIRVASDEEIQVLVYKETYDPGNEYDCVYQAQSNTDGTFFVTSAYTHPSCSASHAGNEFYLVSTFEDNTIIEVTEKNKTAVEISLPSFGTFASVSFNNQNPVATGTIISSNKAITVVSGNLCAENPSTSGTYMSSIPPANYLSQDYVIPHLISQSTVTPGFSLNVVAVESNTEVHFDGEVVQLSAIGSETTFDRKNTNYAMFLNCSKNCLSIQYTTGIRDMYGNFMLSLLPESDFYTWAFFTTLDIHPTSYISLIVQGEDPGNDILLNGVSLEYLDWQAAYGFASAETAIPQGTYVIESGAGRPFVVYVYCHSESYYGGAGYTLLPLQSQGVVTTPLPTTSHQPPPDGNYTLPQITIRVNGTVFTEDGQDMTPQCAQTSLQTHSQNLNAKTTAMVVEVNKAIGTDICLDATDIVVLSGISAMITDGQKGLVDIRQNLEVSGHHLSSELESCAEEISVYLADHGNWEQPIFPDVPDCSKLLFVPPYFDIAGSYWNCNNQGLEGEDVYTMQNTLLFESEVSEVLDTSDGGALDVDCTLAYISEAEKKANAMLSTISVMIAETECAGIINIISQTTSFTAFGNQAYILVAFHYKPQNSATFDEFMTCSLPVHDFIQQHGNWGTQPGSPFLPVPPGCPELEHDGPSLDDEGYQWMCVDIV